MGDGFLILCPPEPHKVLQQAFALMGFIRAYNFQQRAPDTLNIRIAVHYGLMAPPEGSNYIDANINLASRLQGAAPANIVCVSGVLHDIVANTLRQYRFAELGGELKGFGETRFYAVSKSDPDSTSSPAEGRLSFYLSTIDALAQAGNWEAVANTCKQGLDDFKDNPEFWYQLHFAYMVLRKDEEALRAALECIRLGYKLAESFEFAGTYYLRSGNQSKASEAFLKTVENGPKFFHAMVGLAEIYLGSRTVQRGMEVVCPSG